MASSARNLGVTGFGTAVMSAVRIVFLLVGIASTGVILASTVVPYSADLVSNSLPRIRIVALAWLSPPYLFIIVHFIIIVIWKLQDNSQGLKPSERKEEQEVENKVAENTEAEIEILMKASDLPPAIPPEVTTATSASVPAESTPDLANSTWTAAEEAHDTMDATWKAIVQGVTEDSSVKARPRMRKSDTWERSGENRECSPAATRGSKFRKSETFRRVSVEREELFGRAEAFIRTQYEQLRIQRQESVQRYIEMVNAAC